MKKNHSKVLVAIALLAILFSGKLLAQVPNISYSSPQIYIAGRPITPLYPTNTGGGVAPPGTYGYLNVVDSYDKNTSGLAADANGNLYFGQTENDSQLGANWLTKKMPDGSEVVLSSAFKAIKGIAVDFFGSVYVADYYSSTIKVVLSGGGAINDMGSGFSHPTGVVLDAAGNVYVSDFGNNAIYKIHGSDPPMVVASGGLIDQPSGLAIDGAGNIYVTPSGTIGIIKIPVGGGPPVNFGGAPHDFSAVAADAAGNVFATAYHGQYVTEISAAGQSVTLSTISGSPYNITLDPSRNLYVSASQGIWKSLPGFGGYSVDTYNGPSLPAGLTLDPTTGAISGTPTQVSADLLYVIDCFNPSGIDMGYVDITVNPEIPTVTYSSPQTYYLGTEIQPLAPISTRVAALKYTSPASIGSGLNSPLSVAAGAAGDLFIVDFGSNSVKEIAVGGSTVTFATGFNNPAGIAIDPSGNMYVSDRGNNRVMKFPVAGGNPVSIGSGFNSPYGVAVDNGGNVYVADLGNGAVKKIPAAGGAPVTIGSGFVAPYGVALDATGNVYVTDRTKSVITMIPANGSSMVTLGSGLINPAGIALDPSGNVYVASYGSNSVIVIPAGGGTKFNFGSGFNGPTGVAIDGAGNVYIADELNNAIKKIAPIGGYYISAALPAGLVFNSGTGIISGTPTALSPAKAYTITAYNISGRGTAAVNITVYPPPPVISYISPQIYTAGVAIAPLSPTAAGVAAPGYSSSPLNIGSGFDGPSAVAVDAAGNVYVNDVVNNAVYKVPVGGGAQVTMGSGISGPNGVAVDIAGNVYVVDFGNNAIKEILVTDGSTVTVGAGFNQPRGVAIDAAGNVYVADGGNNAVKKIPVGGGTPVIIGSGFLTPNGVAVDGAGNVYVADYGHDMIKVIPAAGGAPFTIGSGFTSTNGIAVDASGNVYVADFSGNAVKEIPVGGGTPVIIGSGFKSPTGVATDVLGNIFIADYGNSLVKEFKPVGGYYINRALPAGLSFANATGIISGTPKLAHPATNYTITGYNIGGGKSATLNLTVHLPLPTISYISPQIYTAGVAIAPLAPTTVWVAAPGYSSSPLNIGSGFDGPSAVAVDAAGNVYVNDVVDNAVYKVPAGGGSQVTISTGFSGPSTGVAVDAAGNVYVIDFNDNAVKEIPVAGGSPVTLGSGFLQPRGLAVDAAGNVFVADGGNSAVKKIPSGGGTPVAIGSGFLNPNGVAVDAAGNVYVADYGHDMIKKIPVGGGAPVTIGSGFTSTESVTVDASGNVYVADFSGNAIKKIPVGGGAPVIIGSGFKSPTGVATDGLGNLFVADYGNSVVKEFKPVGGYYINRALPVGLSFANATGIISGTPTMASPATNYNVTAYNPTGSASATVNIKVTANASLAGLHLSSGALSPVFAVAITSYTASVANAVSSITITPTTSDGAATVKVKGTLVLSGTASAAIPLTFGQNTISTVVNAADGVTTKTYTVVVTRALSNNSNLSNLKINGGAITLTPAFNYNITSYTTSVTNAATTIKVTPATADVNATVKVNGTTVASGTASTAISLNAGPNVITTVVKAADGVTTKTYTITVTRAPSANANLAGLSLNHGVLSPVFAAGTTSYTASVNTTSVTVKPTTSVSTASVKVNNVTVASGTASAAIPLIVGPNAITIAVTAEDGTTTSTYTITITRLSNNANLANLKINSGSVTLTPVFNYNTTSYTANVTNATTSVKITPVVADANATVKINGTTVISGAQSASLLLAIGANTITTIVTAQDGTTTKTYTITVTRAAGPIADPLEAISVEKPLESPRLADDGIVIHQGVSPNGDGVNDFLIIDGIGNYPDNKLTIMNRNGALVYEAKGYDNSSRVFDGHSNKNGAKQLPGTYFYRLDYTVKGVIKHKTGFIILKY